MTTQLASLRARVTDLEQWEKDIAAASIRKHVGKRGRKHVRKHATIRKYVSVRKH